MTDIQPVALEDLPHLLSFICPDDRDTWVKVGQGVKAEFGEDGFQPWLTWSSGGDGFKQTDANQVWRSFRKRGVGFGTVIHLAKAAGWRPSKAELTAEEKRRFREEQEARRAARQAQIEADAAKIARMQSAVAAGCFKIWTYKAETKGQSDYLTRKLVPDLGQIGYFNQTVLLWIDDQKETCGVISGSTVLEFFRKEPKPRPDHISYMQFRRGSICVPLFDGDGKLWSLQVINSTGVKLFPKYGRKSGCFHVLGDPSEAAIIALAEGLATAASVRLATGWPVAIAFDAGNLVPVAPAVRALNPSARLVFCADRDDKGAGEKFATLAANNDGNALVVLPVFGEVA